MCREKKTDDITFECSTVNHPSTESAVDICVFPIDGQANTQVDSRPKSP